MSDDGPGQAGVGTLQDDIAAYLDHLGQVRGLAPNSVAAYRRDLRRYLTFCHARGLAATRQVTGSDLASYSEALPRGDAGPALSPTSTTRALVAVRGFHRYALEAGLAPGDPGREVRIPVAPKRQPASLPPGDVVALLTAVGGPGASALGLRDRALLELLYASGARISEAVGLELADLDVEGASVLLAGSGRRREVPLGGRAVAALDAYLDQGRPVLAAGDAAAVFLNARGGRLSRQSAWTVLQSAADRARIGAAVSPHTLRHSFAAHLMAGGADPVVVEILLGTGPASRATLDPAEVRLAYLAAHPRA